MFSCTSTDPLGEEAAHILYIQCYIHQVIVDWYTTVSVVMNAARGRQSKYTPTLQAGLFVQAACFLDAGSVWWRWWDFFSHQFLQLVNWWRKIPNLIESDSHRKAFLLAALITVVSTIIHSACRGCVNCACELLFMFAEHLSHAVIY